MFAAASGAFETICGDLSEAEARRGEAFIASALGRRRIYRNECAGVYYPFLPADEYFDRGHFPWFADIEAQTPTIRAELQALRDDPGEAQIGRASCRARGCAYV